MADKPLGAAVLMLHHPVTLAITSYRLFAGAPGDRLPPLGEKVARHAKGDATGYKAERPALRLVPLTSFAPVATTSTLVDRLFGPA